LWLFGLIFAAQGGKKRFKPGASKALPHQPDQEQQGSTLKKAKKA
jgi:hypothetical protein